MAIRKQSNFNLLFNQVPWQDKPLLYSIHNLGNRAIVKRRLCLLCMEIVLLLGRRSTSPIFQAFTFIRTKWKIHKISGRVSTESNKTKSAWACRGECRSILQVSIQFLERRAFYKFITSNFQPHLPLLFSILTSTNDLNFMFMLKPKSSKTMHKNTRNMFLLLGIKSTP